VDSLLKVSRKNNLRAIELGAGCGLAGLALVKIKQGVDVLLTDLVEAEEITKRNIARAGIKGASKATFEVLDWTHPLPLSIQGVFDLVLVADCTYNADFIPALVSSLSALIKNSPEALVVVATKTRHSSEVVFFELMEEARFTITEKTHALAPTRLPMEEPKDAERVDVYCFKHEPKRVRKPSTSTEEIETISHKRKAVHRNG